MRAPDLGRAQAAPPNVPGPPSIDRANVMNLLLITRFSQKHRPSARLAPVKDLAVVVRDPEEHRADRRTLSEHRLIGYEEGVSDHLQNVCKSRLLAILRCVSRFVCCLRSCSFSA